MNLAERAHQGLFPGRVEKRVLEVSYSAKFKPFNANAKFDSKKIVFALSRNWLEFSEELRIGLIQHLLSKVIKEDHVKTFELDLYMKFIKNLSKYSKVDKSDPELLESFLRVNKEYFDDEMSRPNLVWGSSSLNKLGHYEYTTDTILISAVLKGQQELLDYVMYHELLHKKLGFKQSGKKLFHHSKEFRVEEAKFKVKDVEKKLRAFLRKKKLVKAFRFF